MSRSRSGDEAVVGAEHVAIAQTAPRSLGLSARTKREVDTWYSFEKAVLALRAAASFEFGDAIRQTLEGLRHCPDLPIKALLAYLRRRQLAKYLRSADAVQRRSTPPDGPPYGKIT